MNKLLIIEDDVTIRNALRILLENQGYFIEEAHDGEEGLQKFDSTFDLLIIDIMMPNISGIDVCRKIREKSYVPILFLTAKSEVQIWKQTFLVSRILCRYGREKCKENTGIYSKSVTG